MRRTSKSLFPRPQSKARGSPAARAGGPQTAAAAKLPDLAASTAVSTRPLHRKIVPLRRPHPRLATIVLYCFYQVFRGDEILSTKIALPRTIIFYD
jgi:hypothetical protein